MDKPTVKAQRSVRIGSQELVSMVGKEHGLPEGLNMEWKLLSDPSTKTFEIFVFWDEPVSTNGGE